MGPHIPSELRDTPKSGLDPKDRNIQTWNKFKRD